MARNDLDRVKGLTKDEPFCKKFDKILNSLLEAIASPNSNAQSG